MSGPLSLRFALVVALLLALVPSASAQAVFPHSVSGPSIVNGVSGMVWHDTDADGLRDAGGEPGLPYVKLCLYQELGEPNGHVDPGESPSDCAFTTGADGETHGPFTIGDVTPGSYVLAVEAATVLSLYALTTASTEFGPLSIDDEVLTGFDVGYRTNLPADVDDNCAVNVVDIEIVSTAFGVTSSSYDLNGDGIVDELDLELAARFWGNRQACAFVDADGDWLPDASEDPDANKVVGPGESDPGMADTDGDALDDYHEVMFYSTDPLSVDSDNDGLNDRDEVLDYASDPWNPDSDGDTLPDGLEAHMMKTDPVRADSDGDGLNDPLEDADKDGVLDPAETSPKAADTDEDGLWDGHDVSQALALAAAMPAAANLPMAGVIYGELDRGTDPRNADTDGDTLADGEEVRLGTNPLAADTDGDGLDDAEELSEGDDGYVTDPNAADSDADTIEDGAERDHGCNPLIADGDGDKLDDARELKEAQTLCNDPDSDDDGLLDGAEVDVHGTNPLSGDSDADRMPDMWEVEHVLNPLVDDADDDPDGDDVSNLREYNGADGDPGTTADVTDPNNPDTDADLLSDGDELDKHLTRAYDSDSDGDQARDGDEVRFATGPLDPDSDGDGIADGVETAWAIDVDADGTICALDTDCDGDGIPDNQEDGDLNGKIAGDTNEDRHRDAGETWAESDPASADSDGDGMSDDWETAQDFDPKDPADGDADADADGLTNTREFSLESNPHFVDSDGDSLPDGFEVDQGLDPTDPDDANQDKDGDDLSNRVEYAAGLPIDDFDADDDGLRDGEEPGWSTDPDGDGKINAQDLDADGDTVVDGAEVFTYGTSPVLQDTDGDTLRDDAEVYTYHTDPLSVDTDGDTLSDNEEVTPGADGHITDPLSRDTDGDTLTDDVELATNPTRADTDFDGANDAQELSLGSDPLDPDSDDDGLLDGAEIDGGTSPTNSDTDADGVPDGIDPDPLRPDTDGDGLQDGAELVPNWNGAWVEAEDPAAHPGAVITDEAFKTTVAVRGESGPQVATWEDAELPPGVYRVLVRARSVDPGDPMQIVVNAGAVTLFEREVPLLSGIYRWYSTDLLTLTEPAGLQVVVSDPKDDGQRVLVDQLMITAADGENTFLRTLALDPDTDQDGLPDGEESPEHTYWFEAEDYRDPALVVTPDLGASNSLTLVTIGQKEEMVRFAPTYRFSPGQYQVFVRVRWDPRAGQRPDPLFHVEANGATIDLFLQEITDQYEWQPLDGLFEVGVDGELSLNIIADGAAGALCVDKLLLTPLAFEIREIFVEEPVIPDPYEGVRPVPGAPWGSKAIEGGSKLAFLVGQPRLRTDPLDMDTDGDGERKYAGVIANSQGWLTDGFEMRVLGANPFSIDTDGDADLYFWDGAAWNFQPDFILDDNGGWDTDNDCIPDGAPNAADGMPDWTDATDCNPLSMDSDDDDLLDPIDPLPADADIDDDGLKDGEEDANLNGGFDGNQETDLGMNYPGTPGYDCIINGLLPGWDTDGDLISDGTERGRTPVQVNFAHTDIRCFVPDADPVTITDPTRTDTDGDGLGDGAEDANQDGAQLKPETAAHTPDTDADGLWDSVDVGGQWGELTVHYTGSAGPTDPVNFDSDGDGLGDGFELYSQKQIDPRNPDTDGDGAGDGDEVRGTLGYMTDPTDSDSDDDGIGDFEEMIGGADGHITNPLAGDTDSDGVSDLEEVTSGADGYITDPTDTDTDGEGLADGDEVMGASGHITNPTDTDTDDDGFPDKYEVDYGTDPTNAADKPPEVNAGCVSAETSGGTRWTLLEDGSYQATGTIVLAATGSDESTLLVLASPRGRPDILGTLPERVHIVPRALPRPVADRLLGPERTDAIAGTITINGTVTVLAGGTGINATGALIVSLGPGVDLTLASDASYAVDPTTGILTVSGSMDSDIQIGPWGFASFDAFDADTEVTIDLATGVVAGKADVEVLMAVTPPVYSTLTASFVFSPTGLLHLYARGGSDVIPLDMIGIDNDFTMGEAEIYINAQEASFLGRAKLIDWQLGDEFFEGGGPSLEIGLDRTLDRFWFSADLSAEAKIQAGGLSLTVSPPVGGHFAFETGIIHPYWLIRAGLELPPVSEVLSISEVLIEIDPSGHATLTPTYPVGDILTSPIAGHLRLLGDVTVHIPLPLPAAVAQEEEEGGAAETVPDDTSSGGPTLDVHLAGEILWRLDLTGCNHVLAANSTIGLGVSVAGVGLMYDFGGSSMHLAMAGSMPNCHPELLSISMVQNGIELGNFGSPVLDELGQINLQPQVGVAVEFDISAATMALAGEYEVGPFDFAASFLLNVHDESMAVTASLDMAVLDAGVDLTGSLDFDGNLTLGGHAAVGVAGFDVFDATFAFTNNPTPPSSHMLTASGSLTIPAVGTATLGGWLDANGSFRLTGSAGLSPGGFTIASAALTWTNTGVSIGGTLTVPAGIGSVVVTGTATPTSFRLTGSATLGLGGFSMNAAVTLSNGGLYASGSVAAAGSFISMSGYITTAGNYLITASGTAYLQGYRIAAATFTLEKTATSFRFQAVGDLTLGSRTLASVTVNLQTGGGFTAGISITWGFTFTATLSVSSTGSFDFTTSVRTLSLSAAGCSLSGSFSLHAWGTSASNVNFNASGTASVKLSGATVFSGGISVSSAGKITVTYHTWLGNVSVTFSI